MWVGVVVVACVVGVVVVFDVAVVMVVFGIVDLVVQMVVVVVVVVVVEMVSHADFVSYNRDDNFNKSVIFVKNHSLLLQTSDLLSRSNLFFIWLYGSSFDEKSCLYVSITVRIGDFS